MGHSDAFWRWGVSQQICGWGKVRKGHKNGEIKTKVRLHRAGDSGDIDAGWVIGRSANVWVWMGEKRASGNRKTGT